MDKVDKCSCKAVTWVVPRLVYPLVLLAVFLFVSTSGYNQNGDGKSYRIKTVVIDAGHGGKDPGAVCKNGKEKDITLSIALKLGKYIQTNFKDVKVIYTRDKDEFVELYKRAEIANNNNADLFISIHVNASKKQDPYGTETYVMGLHKTQSNLEVAMLENSVITKEDDYSSQYEGFDPSSPEGFIIFSLYQNAFLDQSLILAAKIQDQLRERVGRFDRGVKQAGFLVLWKTAMPSILVEVGFISNIEESEYLLNDVHQDYLASAIFRAFRDYKNEMEGNTKTHVNEVDDRQTNETGNDNPKDTAVKVILNTDQNGNQCNQSKDTTSSGFQKSAENLIGEFSSDTIFFCLQLASGTKRIPVGPANFKGLEGVRELTMDGAYKYVYGKTRTFDEIAKIKKEVSALYPDAFVVAFRKGKKIPVNEAIKQTKS